uniref:RanBP2-type domain-containing protein n=1 Tax=viral metagenome TaxID=1070528 RepID=A0A6C0J477_9ZZZZ
MGITESHFKRPDWYCRKCFVNIYHSKDRCLKCRVHRDDWYCNKCQMWIFYPKKTCFKCPIKYTDWYCINCNLIMNGNYCSDAESETQCTGCKKFRENSAELEYIKTNGTFKEYEQFLKLHPGLQPCRHNSHRESCYKCG